jgi:hypothetical protein
VDEPEVLMARVDPLPGGGASLQLGPIERLLLGEFLDDLERRLDAPDATTVRLFPPAYPDDDEAEADYRSMAHADLVDGRLARAQVVRDTLEATELTADETEAWLGVLNDLRLAYGTELAVTQDEGVPDDDDPRHDPYIRYLYLGWLQEQFIQVVTAALPDEVDQTEG